MTPLPNTQRLDKWLWYARILKTRSRAQRLVASGGVRVDGERTLSASRKLRAGNVLTITLPGEIKVLKILDFAQKRGSFDIARHLYEDLSPPRSEKPDKGRSTLRDEGMIVTARPSQRERRKAIQLKQRTAQ